MRLVERETEGQTALERVLEPCHGAIPLNLWLDVSHTVLPAPRFREQTHCPDTWANPSAYLCARPGQVLHLGCEHGTQPFPMSGGVFNVWAYLFVR